MFEIQTIDTLPSSDAHQLLVDRAAITDVTIRYCWALDTKDWPVLDTVFTVDANADLTVDLVGREQILQRIKNALTPMDDTQHMVSNHQIVLNGDSATCRCYLQAQHVRKAAHGGPNFIIAGRYEDQLQRTPEGWRIVFRRLVVMWTEGNPAVGRN
jgi:hypothetical protein